MGPQSLAQNIIARAAAKTLVRVGDIVTSKVDLAMFHDSSGVLLTCPQIELLQKRELTTLYLRGQTIVLPSGDAVECDPVPDFLLDMARAGGLLPSLKQRLSERCPAT